MPSQLVAASAKPKPEPQPSCDGLVEAVLAHACVALVILADGLSNRAPIPDPDQACMRVKMRRSISPRPLGRPSFIGGAKCRAADNFVRSLIISRSATQLVNYFRRFCSMRKLQMLVKIVIGEMETLLHAHSPFCCREHLRM